MLACFLTEGRAVRLMRFFVAKYMTKNLVYLGTSITSTVSTAYPTLTSLWLNSQAPYYTFLNRQILGVGGSTSWYSLARVESVVSGYTPNLVVLEHAVNDDASAFYAKSAEALIRRLRTVLPTTNIIFLAFTRVADKDVDDATNLNQELHDRWKSLCTSYGITFISFADALKTLVDSGATLADYLADTVHPTAVGHQLAHETVRSYVLTGLTGSLPTMPARTYDCALFEAVPTWRDGTDNDAETGTGWSTTGTARKSSTANDTISWTGTFVSFGYNRTTDSTGVVGITIDGGVEQEFNLSGYGLSINYETELSNAEHTVVFRVVSGTVGIESFITI